MIRVYKESINLDKIHIQICMSANLGIYFHFNKFFKFFYASEHFVKVSVISQKIPYFAKR